jgi:hypothetical protein
MKRCLFFIFVFPMLAVAIGCDKTLMVDDGSAALCTGARKAPKVDAGSIDSGASLDDDDAGAQSNARPLWTGNPAACPRDPVAREGACSSGEEGLLCAYRFPDPEHSSQSVYEECSCLADCGDAAGKRHWYCSVEVGHLTSSCPAQQPEDGSSCFGLKGETCPYAPGTHCTCPEDPGDVAWSCQEIGLHTEHPRGLDESKRVRDLSDSERQAWCAWLARRPPGFPPYPDLDPTCDGFYPDTGCTTSTYLKCSMAMPTNFPASACIENLQLSRCSAPLYDLSECVLTMQSEWPTGHGCARFIDAPGCSGTIVREGGPSADDFGNDFCRLRVR